jgi:hypothetical protein
MTGSMFIKIAPPQMTDDRLTDRFYRIFICQLLSVSYQLFRFIFVYHKFRDTTKITRAELSTLNYSLIFRKRTPITPQ